MRITTRHVEAITEERRWIDKELEASAGWMDLLQDWGTEAAGVMERKIWHALEYWEGLKADLYGDWVLVRGLGLGHQAQGYETS